jgi:hypothetical protein
MVNRRIEEIGSYRGRRSMMMGTGDKRWKEIARIRRR